jgi:hypothetical protein
MLKISYTTIVNKHFEPYLEQLIKSHQIFSRIDLTVYTVNFDANHAYDFVVDDINLWFSKLKKGGIFSGHDYINMDWYNDPNFAPNGKDKYIWATDSNGSNLYHGLFGVNPAIDEFCTKNNYNVNVTKEWFGTWI